MATVKKVADAPAEPTEVLPSAEAGSNDATLQDSVAPAEGDTPENKLVDAELDAEVDPSEYKKDELQEQARAAGLDDSGTKDDLAARLSEHAESGAHKPEVLGPHTEE